MYICIYVKTTIQDRGILSHKVEVNGSEPPEICGKS